MRNFNTTAVNLRATLDDLDPLVDASKPVADRLSPFFRNFRAASADLVPTVRDLDVIIKDPGPDNDLVDLTRLQPKPGADRRSGRVQRQRRSAPGRLPRVVDRAARLARRARLLPRLRARADRLVRRLRPLRVTDANGGIGRIGTTFNTFSLGANDLPVVDLAGARSPTDRRPTCSRHRQLQALPGLQRAPGARRLQPVHGSDQPGQRGRRRQLRPLDHPAGQLRCDASPSSSP